MSSDTDAARSRAEAKFKKQQEQAREGAKARNEYEQKTQSVVERTARLRAERLAREAAAANVPAECQMAVTDALLACAEKLLADTQRAEAMKIYKKFNGDQQPKHVRLAATPGLLACAGEKD